MATITDNRAEAYLGAESIHSGFDAKSDRFVNVPLPDDDQGIPPYLRDEKAIGAAGKEAVDVARPSTPESITLDPEAVRRLIGDISEYLRGVRQNAVTAQDPAMIDAIRARQG